MLEGVPVTKGSVVPPMRKQWLVVCGYPSCCQIALHFCRKRDLVKDKGPLTVVYECCSECCWFADAFWANGWDLQDVVDLPGPHLVCDNGSWFEEGEGDMIQSSRVISWSLSLLAEEYRMQWPRKVVVICLSGIGPKRQAVTATSNRSLRSRPLTNCTSMLLLMGGQGGHLEILGARLWTLFSM